MRASFFLDDLPFAVTTFYKLTSNRKVEVFRRPSGKANGNTLPETATNLAWGESDRKTLYITASKSLYRIRLRIAGVRAGT